MRLISTSFKPHISIIIYIENNNLDVHKYLPFFSALHSFLHPRDFHLGSFSSVEEQPLIWACLF